MPGKTELIWDGKYDAHGKRVVPLCVALTFLTVEAVVGLVRAQPGRAEIEHRQRQEG